ncbi:MAG: hypothetical protein KGJ23_07650 [Euryarchaeota archaeon]|nr:hypothetical protein [Euryarchaeota archaeon]MDE1836473.1 hypothetical protein [Euryarchaeota archaeon]MDE1880640.1 hypothetical protein [Euryarchaeota archaeon]MDE2044221.1 hypothetical protein [Thermoplasmata archaeon]
MPGKPQGITVSVEEEALPAGDTPARRVHLAMTLQPAEGAEVTTEEVQAAVKLLSHHLESAIATLSEGGPSGAGPRPDRPLPDLLETYRPRNLELVDALLWEGELTPTEHQVLQAAVRTPPERASKGPPPKTAPPPEAPLATIAPSASSSQGPARTSPRSVDALLRELDLKDMRDANRARGRRMISYEEWAALKSHFEKRS